MVRAPLPHLAALLCGVLAAVAVGCGDRSNLIPQSRADDLTQQLADIKAKVDQGECDGITQAVRSFRSDATSLSPAVDKALRVRLREGADALLLHAAADCATNAAGTTTETPDTTTTDTSTQTTATQTTTATTTVPPQTTTTDTSTQITPPATTTTPPPTDTGAAPDTGGVTPEDGTQP